MRNKLIEGLRVKRQHKEYCDEFGIPSIIGSAIEDVSIPAKYDNLSDYIMTIDIHHKFRSTYAGKEEAKGRAIKSIQHYFYSDIEGMSHNAMMAIDAGDRSAAFKAVQKIIDYCRGDEV